MAPRSAPRAGTGYIGLESWLANNQPQAAAMADNLASGINAQGQAASRSLADAQERFQYGADRSALNYDDEGFYGADGAFTPEGEVAALQRNARAQADLERGYGGPQTLEEFGSYGTGRTTASSAQRDANLAADVYGRQALLQDAYGKSGGYSQGAQRLDSALVGAAGGEKLDAAKSAWGGLLGKFDTASKDARAYASDIQQRNKDVASRYADAAGKAQAGADARMRHAKEDQRRLMDEERAQERQIRQDTSNANRAAERSGRMGPGYKGRDGLESWRSTWG